MRAIPVHGADADNKVLRRIKEEQKEDSCYGKNSHGRSLDDLDMFEAELNKKVIIQSHHVAYERDDYCAEFTAPILVKTLPEAVAQRLDSMEDLCFYGILSLDTHPVAWVSVDDSVCLWIPPLTLAQPPPTRVVHFRDYVTAVAIVRTDPDKTYACDGVPPYFLAVALRDCIQLMQLYLTETELVVRETGIEVAIDSFVCKMVATDNGRLFIGCKDGFVYEIDCAEPDDSVGSLFYPRKSRKTNCSKSGGGFSAHFATIWNVMKDAVRGPKSQDPVSFLVYDASRHIIMALTQARSILSGGGAGGASNAQLHAFFLDSRAQHGELECKRRPALYKGPFPLDGESHISGMDSALREHHLEEIIALHPITKDECSRLNAVLISSTGCRVYVSVTEHDGFSCRAVRPPPSVDQGGWAMNTAKSARVTASAYQHGLWVVTSADRTRAGGLFCISQDRNAPPRPLPSPTQYQQRKVEIVSAFPAAAVQMLPASVWALQEIPSTFWYCNPTVYCGIDGSARILTTHELFAQHVVQHRKFLLLCRNGIFVVSRRLPWEKLEHNLSRFPELLASPDKLCKSLRIPKEQMCATAVLWWVRSGVMVDNGPVTWRSLSSSHLNDAQAKSLQLFSTCEKHEPGRGGLGLLIALSRFLRPVWPSSSVLTARDWARVAAELELVQRFVEMCGIFEIVMTKDRVGEGKDVIKHVELVEMISHCQQLCALMHLVVKGGGGLPSLQGGGLGNLAHNYLKNMRGLGPDPILELVRSLSEASCVKVSTAANKKARWNYEDAPTFRDKMLLTRLEQEQLDALLTRLLPPSKLAQARADKELSKARELHSGGEVEGVRQGVRRAQEHLMSISRDLTLEDLKRYAGRGDVPSSSFGFMKQPLAFIEMILDRFSNQSLVAAEEVHLLWDFMQDMYRDADEASKSQQDVDVALELVIDHAGLYRSAQYAVPASPALDRTAPSAMYSMHAPRVGGSGLLWGQASYGEEREERAMWPLLRGMLEPHWRAFVHDRHGHLPNGQAKVGSAEQAVSAVWWTKLVGLVGRRYLDSSQTGGKALVELERLLRCANTVEWLKERAPNDLHATSLAECFLSHCHAAVLHAAGLYAKAGHVCYVRAKQLSEAPIEERIDALMHANKAALLNGGHLPEPHVSASSLEFEAALAQLQLHLKRRSADPAADQRYGRGLMDMKALFEAACAEELYDIALDICALSTSYTESPPAQVLHTLWRNMLVKAREQDNLDEVMHTQGRKFIKREGFFPLVQIMSLLEDELLLDGAASASTQGVDKGGRRGGDAARLLHEIGVEPLRLVQAYMERLDGRLDEAAQERSLMAVRELYVHLLERALETGSEALLPLATIDNDLVRLDTHPALRRLRHHLQAPRALLLRVRARLAAA